MSQKKKNRQYNEYNGQKKKNRQYNEPKEEEQTI